ncbi:hypothetical protein NDU88_009053 [Pleurodeles waltl]|uniref:Uncharacterized protein n=1 Tax=Pleurodeles waltl TaxID=8319 RepID=A0AAV7PR49_PLEWA|nr:hypothetical protein NDU88_009053 [Pleurodeles waltl]
MYCNRAITATTRAPETSEDCPRGILQDDEHQEVVHNPDNRDEGALMRKEKEPEKREGAEPEEEGNAEPKDKEEDPEEQRDADLTTVVPTEAKERRGRTRHVSGGAWLTQVRSCLRVKFLPVWNWSRSERGSQGRGREEGVVGKIVQSACKYI